MKERPILFSAQMVRAILDGRKTQTRRVVKGIDETYRGVEDGKAWQMDECGDCHDVPCPYGVPGDRLWVRETWQYGPDVTAGMMAAGKMSRRHVVYAATVQDGHHPPSWRPSIHMPRWASRITLEVIGVRVERLQEISEADAKAEGIYSACIHVPPPIHTETRYVAPGVKMVNAADEVDYEAPAHRTAKHAFECLWESINGYGSWSVNPWVWVVEFKRIKP